jgi:hypothetical protein
MEEITLANTQSIIEQFINDFAATYKTLLTRDGKKASGNLINSVKSLGAKATQSGIEANISIADYWKYVENGRRQGKFPPPDKMLEWVKVKHILPSSSSLKITKPQLAYLIGRKIARYGIKPGNQFRDALDMTWQKWKPQITAAINADLSKHLAQNI